MNIYTSYFTRVNLLQDTSKFYVAISNSKPDWLTIPCTSIKDLAPEWKDVEAFKKGNITFKDLRDRYVDTLHRRYGDLINIELDLSDIAGDKDVVLVCWEKDDSKCHRSILADIFAVDYRGEL